MSQSQDLNTTGTSIRKSVPGSPWGGSLGAGSISNPTNQLPKGFDRSGLLARPYQWAKTASQMIASDPVLADLSHRTRSAMLQGEWSVLPGQDDNTPTGREALENAEYIRLALGLEGRSSRLSEGTGGWEGVLGRCGRWGEVGWRVLEPTYWFQDGKVWLKDLCDIEPSSITGFVRDSSGEVIAVEQDTSASGLRWGKILIPSEDLLILTANQTSDVVTGQGLLLPCYPWWLLKQSIAKQLEVAVKRWSNPTIALSADPQEIGVSTGLNGESVNQIIDEASKLAEKYAAGEDTWLRETKGLVYRVLGQGTFTPGVFKDALAVCDQQMAQAWSASYTQIGLSGEGSRAIGEVHYDSWKVATCNRADYIAASFQKIIRKLLELNRYPDGVPAQVLPRLVHSGLEVDGLRDGLGNIVALVEADVLTKTPELERRLLKLFGIKPGIGSDRSASERKPASGYALPANSVTDGGAGRPVESL